MKALKNKNRVITGTIAILLLSISFLSVNANTSEGITDEATTIENSNELNLENWMTDMSEWILSGSLSLNMVTDNEAELSVEEWMLDMKDQMWDTDMEENIKVESWMLDMNNENWLQADTEKEIELENWMTDLSAWNVK